MGRTKAVKDIHNILFNEQIAFIIIHEATEGVFSLINWWVGENMLNTHIFLTAYDTAYRKKPLSFATNNKL